MSEASAEAYEPGEREVCISIRDPAAPLPALSPQFLAVLSLEFQDDPEPGWEERDRSITEAQADQVIEFVERHVADRRIVVHCLVGVSRSPSLAAGLMVAYGRWAEPTGSSIQGCINASWALALAGSGRGAVRKPRRRRRLSGLKRHQPPPR